MKGDLFRAFGAFVAILLFGCAVYLIAICPTKFSAGRVKRDNPSGSGRLFAEATEQSGNDFSSASSSPSADTAVERETMQTTRQENRTQDQPKSNSQSALQTSLSPAREPIFQQPVAFAEASPNPESSAEGIEEINLLRQEFIEQIGGYDQDPSDQGYRDRWRVAQQLLDEQLRAELGEEVFNRLQNESANSQLPEE